MRTLLRAALLPVALLAAACGGADSGDGAGPAVDATGPADAQVVTVVSNDRLEFEPARVRVKVGVVTLTHRNGGSVPHNLVFEGDLGGTETLAGGRSQSLRLTFERAGTYDFVCTIHSDQEGTVIVG